MKRVKRKTSRVRDTVVGDATVVAASRRAESVNPGLVQWAPEGYP